MEAVKRKNLILGLVLCAFVITSMIMAMIMFAYKGLPKDPKALERYQQRESAR